MDVLRLGVAFTASSFRKLLSRQVNPLAIREHAIGYYGGLICLQLTCM